METRYEQLQQFNAALAWAHSLRYRHVQSVITGACATLQRTVRIIDIGCAHAKLFAELNSIADIDYRGIDTDESFIATATERYGHLSNFRASNIDAASADIRGADMITALETLEHLPEAKAVRLVEKIASARPMLFVASFPVEIGPSVWAKNLSSYLFRYKRHREYTWAETFWAGVNQLDKVRPHETGHRGFDWRWLVATIRHNMRITTLRKLPFSAIPLHTSIFVVAEPRQ